MAYVARDVYTNNPEMAAMRWGWILVHPAVPASAQLAKDMVNVGPGERYDMIWEAREPGKWLVHCHIPDHTTNDNVEEQGGGGLTMVIDVAP